jgi:pimeloyl-ACP methyl ester carboxylesterase
MTPITITLCTGGAILLAIAVFALAPRLRLRRDAGGDRSRGLVVFVGGLRWLGVRWGLRSIPGGLRRASFAGKVVYWNWHEPVLRLFCLSVYCNRPKIEAEARRLACFLADERRQNPDRPLYVMGCSAGGYITLRALELLPDGVNVDSAALLSPAVDPRRDLSPALAHVSGPLVNSSSLLDWFVLGLGTWVFRTADGTRSASAGMVGFAGQDGHGAIEIRWHPRMILSGRLGGHASCSPPAYITKYIAPAMGIPKA